MCSILSLFQQLMLNILTDIADIATEIAHQNRQIKNIVQFFHRSPQTIQRFKRLKEATTLFPYSHQQIQQTFTNSKANQFELMQRRIVFNFKKREQNTFSTFQSPTVQSEAHKSSFQYHLAKIEEERQVMFWKTGGIKEISDQWKKRLGKNGEERKKVIKTLRLMDGS